MNNNFKLNLIYCFDENYNTQAAVSIYSFLRNYKNSLNIYILHNNPSTFKNYKNKLSETGAVANIQMFKFENPGYTFPNLTNKHVSEATYYRLFLDMYLPESVENFMYVDADTVIIKDVTKTIKDSFLELNDSEYFLIAKEEIDKNTIKETTKRLNKRKETYFNAGVMFMKIDNDDNYFIKLRKLITQLNTKIQWWDQDVLNAFFDDKYIRLDGKLNSNANFTISKISNTNSDLNMEPEILHYQGKSKPWKWQGLKIENSLYFHNYFMDLNNVDKLYLEFESKFELLLFTLRTLFLKPEYTKNYTKRLLFNSLVKGLKNDN